MHIYSFFFFLRVKLRKLHCEVGVSVYTRGCCVVPLLRSGVKMI